MNILTFSDTRDKLTRIQSERRGELLVRIRYTVEQSGPCRVYDLQGVDELEQVRVLE